MKRIALFYGHVASNLGDLAINKGVEALVRTAFPESPLNVVVHASTKSEHLSSMRSSFTSGAGIGFSQRPKSYDCLFGYISDPSAFLADCGAADADLLLLNSGELLFQYSNDTNLANIFWHALAIYAGKACGKSVFILPSTFGPFDNAEARGMMSSLLTLADGYAAREASSQSIISQQLGVKKPKLLLDPAFFVERRFATDTREQPKGGSDVRTLGLVMRSENWGLRLKFGAPASPQPSGDGQAPSTALSFSIDLLSRFLSSAGRRAVIFAQTAADRDLASAISSTLKDRGFGDCLKKCEPRSVDAYLDELSQVDHLVSARFHALILGLLTGAEVSGVYFDQHGHKIPGLFEFLKLEGRPLNLSRVPPASASALILADIEKSVGSRRGLAESLSHLKEQTVDWLKGAETASANPSTLLSAANAIAAYGSRLQRCLWEAEEARKQLKHVKALERARHAQQETKRELDASKARQRAQGDELHTLKAELAALRAEYTRLEGSRIKRLAAEAQEECASLKASHKKELATLKTKRAELKAVLLRACRVKQELAYRLAKVRVNHAGRPLSWPLVPLRLYQTFKSYRKDRPKHRARRDADRPIKR